ncbi:MAG: GatB/YqeY domain-containing protein [Chloroflexi bacterium]|nr:GatB/YqeY domain-containing protein [Chloroflexota bacterium]
MADLKTALRTGDVARREAIRMLRAAMLNERIELGRELSDEEAGRVVMRIVKRHRESIDEFERGGRADLVATEQAQLAAIAPYLPAQIDEAEIVRRVNEAIAATGAAGTADIGKVMRHLSGELRGKADLKAVN